MAYSSDEIVEMDSIEVTAKKTILEDEITSPVPIKIISKEEITKRGAVRLQDLLYLQEGVTFVRNGTKLSPSIRGFSSEHTLFLIDGQRIANEPTNKYDLERITLTNIERIEIIKGPFSTLYGPDALGGVINLITTKTIKDQVSVTLRNATYDGKSPSNAATVDLDKKLGDFGLSLFGTHVKEDPLYFNIKETIDDKKEINSVGSSVYYNKKNFEFNVKANWSNDQHESLYYNFLNSSYVYDLDHHERFFAGGEFKYRAGKVKHIAKLSHSSYEKEGNTYLQDNDQLMMSKIARIYVNETGYRAEFTQGSHFITSGVNNRREDFYGNAFNYNNHSKYLPSYNSLFVIDQWGVNDRLIVVPSISYEHLNYFEDKVLTQFGATYSFDDKMEETIKFNYAQGYRVPTPKDLYVDVLVMKGNDQLQPETTNSYSLEYRNLNGLSDLKVALFYNQINNFIQEYFNPALGKYTYRNANGVNILGEEFFYRRGFRHHENSLSYTHLDAKDGDGSRLVNRATHKAILNTTIFPGEQYSLANDISCSSDELLYDHTNTIRKFSYCSFDLAFIYNTKQKYQFLLKGTNLLNKYERGIPQRPRMIALTINAHF
jgi:outer membrane receptor for ferrienterochelin and colicins